MANFNREVKTAQEYKETVGHAEALGFEIHDVHANGTWDAEGTLSWPGNCEIEKVGREYFYIPMTYDETGEEKVFKCKPRDDANLVITFSDC